MKPDLVAPGNRIIGTLGQNSYLEENFTGNEVRVESYDNSGNTGWSDHYSRLSGTSMAAGFVSGTVALMLQKQPSLANDLVKARLMKSARKVFPATSSTVDEAAGIRYRSQYDAFTVGAGYLNAAAALANTGSGSGHAASPVAVRDSVTGKVRLLTTWTGNLWGFHIVWGDNIVWGDANRVLIHGEN